MRSLADFEDYIYANFVNEDCGINLSKFKNKIFERIIPVDWNENSLIDFEKLKSEINHVTDFFKKFYTIHHIRPLWYKINVVDQAVNEYVGIGFLNLKSDWLKFVIDYLYHDRADEGGDTILVIFDPEFLWAVCFTYSQDDKSLTIEILEK